jgi:hypothetical protein
MKRYAIALAAAFALSSLGGNAARAGWCGCDYGGWQPWWNIFAHRNHCLSPEEERLQRFWHDYYDALKRYYNLLDHIDWVAYYKNHGYQINAGCGGYGGGPCGGCQRIQFAPVFVSPTMQWAVPNSALIGPPTMPPGPPPGMWGGGPGCGPGGPGMPMSMGPGMPGGPMPVSYPPPYPYYQH